MKQPGDWDCPQCGDHQFARNRECRKCGAPNPDTPGVWSARKPRLGASGATEKWELCEKIKEWQRRGEGHKATWYKFCERVGTNHFDPSRHEVEDLRKFMDQCEKGHDLEAEEALLANSNEDRDPEKNWQVKRVKDFQKQGDEYKQCWYDFLQTQGTTNYDPNRHEAAVLKAFMDHAEATMPTPIETARAQSLANKRAREAAGGGHVNPTDWYALAEAMAGPMAGPTRPSRDSEPAKLLPDWSNWNHQPREERARDSGVGAGGKPGDWVCTNCQNINFSYRNTCNKCHESNKGATRIGLKVGDWICPGCGDLVFASKDKCKMCKTAKPDIVEDAGAPIAAAKASQEELAAQMAASYRTMMGMIAGGGDWSGYTAAIAAPASSARASPYAGLPQSIASQYNEV